MILSTTHPTFKPLAGIVRINEAGRLKRALLNQLSLHRGASEIVLRPVYLFARTVVMFTNLLKSPCLLMRTT